MKHLKKSISGILLLQMTSAYSAPGRVDCLERGEASLTHSLSNLESLAFSNSDRGDTEECCHPGAPINPSTGEVYIKRQPDFGLKNEAGNFGVYRVYKSLDQSKSSLGSGWRLNIDTNLSFLGDKILYTDEHGAQYRFTMSNEAFTNTQLKGVKLEKKDNVYLLQKHQGMTYEFQASTGKLSSIFFNKGQKVSFNYDVKGKLSSMVDAWGRSLEFVFKDEKLFGVRQGTMPVVVFEYKGDVLHKVVRADGSFESMEYSSKLFSGEKQLLTALKDGEGRFIEVHKYDNEKRGIYSKSLNEGEFVLDYKKSKKGLTHVVVTNVGENKKESFFYDRNGRMVEGSSSLGIYSADKNTLDRNNRVTSQVKGNITTDLTYSENGYKLPKSVKQSDGETSFETKHSYDKDGRLVYSAEPSIMVPGKQKITKFKYKNGLLVQSVIEGYTLGSNKKIKKYLKKHSYAYNKFGQKVKEISPLGNEITFQYYDQASNLFNRGRLKKVTYPDKSFKEFKDYDFWGNASSITNNGKITANLGFNKLGVLVSDQDGSQYAYDKGQQVAIFIDTNGVSKSYVYDNFRKLKGFKVNEGKLQKFSDSKSGEDHFFAGLKFNESNRGNLKNVDFVDAAGKKHKVEFSYDVRNNLTEANIGSHYKVKFQYDDENNLVKEYSKQFGEAYYSYDLINRKVFESKNGIKKSFSYHVNGKLASVNNIQFSKTKEGDIVAGNGFLRKTKFNVMTGETTNIFAPAKDVKLVQSEIENQDGQIQKMVYPNGFNYTVEKIPNGYQFKDFKGNVFYRKTVAKNKLNYKLGKISGDVSFNKMLLPTEEKLSNGTSWKYEYDSQFRPVSIKSSLAKNKHKISYNRQNQIGSVSNDFIDKKFKWDILGNPLSSALKPVKNGKGQTIQLGKLKLSYSKNGRIEKIQNGKNVTNYKYDENGRRFLKQVNGKYTFFAYDSYGNLIYEGTPADKKEIMYVYDGGDLVSYTKWEDKKVSSFYVRTDFRKTPKAIFDEAGKVVAVAKDTVTSVRYKTLDGKNWDLNVGFPGFYHDVESGLDYNHNRYYSAETAQYLTPDPKRFEGGVNYYAYANSNMYNYIDPTGLTAEVITSSDAQYCRGNLEKNDFTPVDGKTLPDDGSVYRVGSNRWSESHERGFADWVKKNISRDFYQQTDIPTDCADAAAMLRAIYARIHNLPAMFTDGNNVKGSRFEGTKYGHFSREFRNYRTVPDWNENNWKENLKKDKRFRVYLGHIRMILGTGTVPLNTYPVKLAEKESNGDFKLSRYVNEGMVLLSSGHTRFISSISPGKANPLIQMSSTSGVVVRELAEDTIEISKATINKGQRGYLRWNWVVNCGDAGWKHVSDRKMPGFSLQQYASDQLKGAEQSEFMDYVNSNHRGYLNSALQEAAKNGQVEFTAEDARDLMSYLISKMRKRHEAVERGYQHYQKNPQLLAEKDKSSSAYDTFSTPSLDKSIRKDYAKLKPVLKEFGLEKEFEDKVNTDNRINPEIEGYSISGMTVLKAIENKTASFEPWVHPAERYGLGSEYKKLLDARKNISALEKTHSKSKQMVSNAESHVKALEKMELERKVQVVTRAPLLGNRIDFIVNPEKEKQFWNELFENDFELTHIRSQLKDAKQTKEKHQVVVNEYPGKRAEMEAILESASRSIASYE